MNIGLGTVQFGLDYGVSNAQGRTSPEEVERILQFAQSENITVLDTAAQYGASEEVLGNCIGKFHQFNIVTKTPTFKKPKINLEDAKHLRNVFTDSLRKLGQEKIYGLLVHHADDLLAEGGQYLMDAMLELKALGLVSKIGASVYDGKQIDQILDHFEIDLIQVPINVFDQRLIANGKLAQLKARGIEIHARSVFLQGLLLMPLGRVTKYFEPLKQNIQSYQRYLAANHLSLLQGALAFASSCKEIDQVILGVCSLEELREILGALRSLPQDSLDFSGFFCQDEQMINPALWKLA
jgi:aryl-alcohol dehydrogenase-like predicted oxidoreductase